MGRRGIGGGSKVMRAERPNGVSAERGVAVWCGAAGKEGDDDMIPRNDLEEFTKAKT
jgi:hypothetical protein